MEVEFGECSTQRTSTVIWLDHLDQGDVHHGRSAFGEHGGEFAGSLTRDEHATAVQRTGHSGVVLT
jgi:hypothetical protein